MSRVGKVPIEIPSGVEISTTPVSVTIKGPKGSAEVKLGQGIKVSKKDSELVVECVSSSKQARANFGTTRAVINNFIIGVNTKWKKELELHGVGYGAVLKGRELVINAGLSHEVSLTVPEGIDCKAQKTDISFESHNRQLVGNFAAKVKKVRPPEPYLGKGIRYKGEQIRRKAGKAGK